MVTRFDPFQDLDAMASRLLSQATDMGTAMRAMPTDLFRSGDHYVLLCDLPGVDPGSIDIGVDGRVLTIRAERTRRDEGAEWLTRERPSGTFARQLTLGSGLDLDRIEASYNDGVLSVLLPVADEAKPRRIQVNSSGQSKSISGSVSSGSIGSGDQQSQSDKVDAG
jgi:HSP20 family protein